MSSTDTYLVEKLKEILLRLYPNQTKSLITTTPSSHFSSELSPEQVKVDLEFETVLMPKVGGDTSRINEEVLNESLTEFIKVLKMSLSATHDRSVTPHDTQSKANLPTVTTSSLEFEFNLSAADIADLNDMMNDSQDNSVQLKHIFIILLYLIIALAAIIGNLLVVQLVIRSRRLHTLTHVLLANLAVADLMMATINIPFSAARVILKEWPFGSLLCQIVPFIQVVSVYVISYTMVVIALDRYQVIMNPLGRRLKSSEGIPLVLAIWILSILLSLPYALHHKVVNVLTLGVVKRCQAEFHSITSRQWLTVGTFLLQYLVPLLLTTISYFSIMKRLNSRSAALGATTQRQAEVQSRAKVKTIRMLILTVICFAVSWAPINGYHLLTHFGLVRHNSVAILVSHIIAMSSCCESPYIYCWYNEHFRQEASRWSRCFRTRRSPFVHPGFEVNGMLRRDVITRNQSSTPVHTTSFRSQLLQNLTASNDPRSPSRVHHPEFLFLTTTVTSPSASLPAEDADANLSITSVFKNSEIDSIEQKPHLQTDKLWPSLGNRHPNSISPDNATGSIVASQYDDGCGDSV